ncbi:MAG: hypothetical protein WAX80_03130 [Minisyncoccia bacterium]
MKMEKKNLILYTTLVLAIIGVVLRSMAEAYYLYWTIWWYDVLLHFLVPFTGGLGIYWGLFYSGLIFRNELGSRMFRVAIVFVCVMAVVVGWEIFEFVYEFRESTEGYELDTLIDLILGTSGALLATLICTKPDSLQSS